jgi:hypothetical protein
MITGRARLGLATVAVTGLRSVLSCPTRDWRVLVAACVAGLLLFARMPRPPKAAAPRHEFCCL